MDVSRLYPFHSCLGESNKTYLTLKDFRRASLSAGFAFELRIVCFSPQTSGLEMCSDSTRGLDPHPLTCLVQVPYVSLKSPD